MDCNEILKICQECNEHLLIANVTSLTRHLHRIGMRLLQNEHGDSKSHDY